MWNKFQLNLGPCPHTLHPISTYTCEVTITPKMCGASYIIINLTNHVYYIKVNVSKKVQSLIQIRF